VGEDVRDGPKADIRWHRPDVGSVPVAVEIALAKIQLSDDYGC
jgi:hypothetical protein